MRFLILSLVGALCFILDSENAIAQLKTPELEISAKTTISSKHYQPFWLHANQYGAYDPYSRTNNMLEISGITEINNSSFFDYAYGLDMVGRVTNNSSTLFLSQAYVSGKAGVFRLDIGRKKQTWGEHAEKISAGSMALSRNATPIPMVNISMPEFYPVPLTHQFIQFKGNLSHGWFENTRYVKDVYLHQKSFYLQAGFDDWPVQGYGGMVHIAQWGGESPTRGKLGSSLQAYPKIFFASEGGSSAPTSEQENALGNHLGIWDFGLKASVRDFKINVYWQHFFEDYSGMSLRDIGDGFYGLNIKNKKGGFISDFVWEFIYTKKQSGRGRGDRPGDVPFCEEENCGFKYGGRDNYYNNGLYRSGWTYHGFILGNPLLITNREAEVYLGEDHNLSGMIVSNRMLGHHVGFSGKLSPGLSYKTFITYTRHYGTYREVGFGGLNPDRNLEAYAFYPPLNQWYFLADFGYRFKQNPNIQLTTKIAFDYGELSDNTGLLMGIKWNVK